jgi:hypothetical protein
MIERNNLSAFLIDKKHFSVKLLCETGVLLRKNLDEDFLALEKRLIELMINLRVKRRTFPFEKHDFGLIVFENFSQFNQFVSINFLIVDWMIGWYDSVLLWRSGVRWIILQMIRYFFGTEFEFNVGFKNLFLVL